MMPQGEDTCIEAISAIEQITARKPAKVTRYIHTRPARPPLIRPKVLAVNCASHVDIRMQAIPASAYPGATKKGLAD